MRCSPEPGRRERAAAGADRGFTLVEVMAAGTILSILVLGMTRLWGVYDRMSFDLLLRQKAVFVLAGEMERLALLFDSTSFGSGPRPATTGYTALPNLSGSGTRETYATNSLGVTFATGTASIFAATDSMVWVYGSGSTAQNFVFLDRSRNLLARISWIECPVTNITAVSCWGATGPGKATTSTCYPFSGTGTSSTACLLVTLVVDYPFTLRGAAPVQTAPTLSTLTLNTIVGRRK
ncbi:MAG: prepilin-type N-terminal cleavage/methylation domain-containing protein [Acidisphaera sp.]|nr:prepilin-type N-terminal cleavage/methylation domain-containing protein [Acidisphaera sp.]